jgi:hypothetical protein
MQTKKRQRASKIRLPHRSLEKSRARMRGVSLKPRRESNQGLPTSSNPIDDKVDGLLPDRSFPKVSVPDR